MSHRDESKIIDGVTSHESVTVSLPSMFGYRTAEVYGDNVRVEREITLNANQYAALYDAAGAPQKMDRHPGEPVLKHEGVSALDVFGPPSTGQKIAAGIERLKDTEARKREEQD